MLFLCSLDEQTAKGYDGTRQNLDSITDQMVRGLQGAFPSPPMLLEQMRTLQANMTDEIGRLNERIVTEVAKFTTRVDQVKTWAGTIGVVLGVLFSGIGYVIWQAFVHVMNKH